MTRAWLLEESSYAFRVLELNTDHCPAPAAPRPGSGRCIEEEQHATCEVRASTSRLHQIATDKTADSWPRVRVDREHLSGVPYRVIMPAHGKMQDGPGLGYCCVRRRKPADLVLPVAGKRLTDHRGHGCLKGLVRPGAASVIAHGLLRQIVEGDVQFQGRVTAPLMRHGSVPRARPADDRPSGVPARQAFLEALSGRNTSTGERRI